MIGERAKGVVEEPREPHALAASFDPNAIHSIIPVTNADEWKAVDADGARMSERAETVLVDRRFLVGDRWEIVHLVLLRLELTHLDERHDLVEDGIVAGRTDVVIHDIR